LLKEETDENSGRDVDRFSSNVQSNISTFHQAAALDGWAVRN